MATSTASAASDVVKKYDTFKSFSKLALELRLEIVTKPFIYLFSGAGNLSVVESSLILLSFVVQYFTEEGW
jgi:hypothetical protein